MKFYFKNLDFQIKISVRIVWGKEGERPQIFMSNAARGRSMAQTREICRQAL
jgi:hypothetical protein